MSERACACLFILFAGCAAPSGIFIRHYPSVAPAGKRIGVLVEVHPTAGFFAGPYGAGTPIPMRDTLGGGLPSQEEVDAVAILLPNLVAALQDSLVAKGYEVEILHTECGWKEDFVGKAIDEMIRAKALEKSTGKQLDSIVAAHYFLNRLEVKGEAVKVKVYQGQYRLHLFDPQGKQLFRPHDESNEPLPSGAVYFGKYARPLPAEVWAEYAALYSLRGFPALSASAPENRSPSTELLGFDPKLWQSIARGWFEIAAETGGDPERFWFETFSDQRSGVVARYDKNGVVWGYEVAPIDRVPYYVVHPNCAPSEIQKWGPDWKPRPPACTGAGAPQQQ